jgi:hypothetical protein
VYVCAAMTGIKLTIFLNIFVLAALICITA